MEISNDKRLTKFMKSVIICTEFGYDPTTLERILKMKFELNYEENYLQLLDKVIMELLQEKKTTHLQAYGY